MQQNQPGTTTPDTPPHKHINWVQLLGPLIVITMTAFGSILWYLLQRTQDVETLRHDIMAHENESRMWQDRIKALEDYAQNGSILLQEAKSNILSLSNKLDSGTDDRFRASDYNRERQALQIELKRLEDLCVARYTAIDSRLNPIELHFWRNHWGGEGGGH